ncbi:hypothetical protein ACF07L_12230 [Streptomyces anulatus]|uniref:hypothetical protein n=1 Tax=Streptomyces anulatus TaxID=1892 RepID=UPI0036F84B69
MRVSTPSEPSWILAATAEGSDPQQDVTYRAPVGSVDFMAFDDEGNSYEIPACHDCLPWHAEVVMVAGEVLIREWRAIGGPQFQELIRTETESSSLKPEPVPDG